MNSENDVFSQAKEYEHKNQFALAIQYYQRAITQGEGGQALAYQGLCRALARLKRFDEAIREGHEWLRLNPDSPMARRTLGNIFFLQSDYEQAEKEFVLALTLEPDNPVNMKNLSLVYGALGEYNKALEPLRKFINLCPDDLDGRFALAGLYTQQKDYKTAFATLNEIFRIKPTSLNLYLAYALVPVHIVAKAFAGTNLLVQIGVVILFLSVAAFAPAIISVPVGILLSIYFLLGLVIISKSRIKSRNILYVSFLSIALCGLYWLFVWFHHNIDVWSNPILQRYTI
jgi:tetratricopeptide (TPR) repeat protein